MRLGYNLAWLGHGGGGGVGRYALELLGALVEARALDQVVVFTAREVPVEVEAAPWRPSVEVARLPVEAASRAALAAQFGLLPPLARRRALDVVHNPAAGPPAMAPGVATVVTLHDLIWLRQADAWGSRSAQRAARVVQFHCARRCDRAIAVSAASRDDFVQTAGLDPARVDVVPHGVQVGAVPAVPPAQLRDSLGLGDGPVVLCVAQKRPYKNLAALVRVAADLRDLGVTVVLPGGSTPHQAELEELAARLGVGDRVRLLDWVSEAELEGLFRLASCLVLPSFMEGAGLPVLEAMARGVPVACSDRWALPEMAGDAALLFDPSDQAAVTAAVRRLVSEPELARELAARGRARAARFTWRRTAEGTLAAYRRALG